jgi:hypothetical protein
MGIDLGQARRGWKGVMIALAFLALALKVLSPPGWMIADASAGPGGLIVICTGQGQLLFDASGHDAPAHKSRPDVPCAFSGHGAGAPPAAGPLTGVAFSHAFAPAPRLATADLAPGRGLAAPPPPSHAPPQSS